MSSKAVQTIDQDRYIRSKLFDRKKGPLQKYAEIVIGEYSLWKLLKYELITCLFGPLPGAFGLLLRKLFYPLLFEQVGRGVVFGRNIVVRNASKIRLGDRVLIDDYALLDGRGSGDDGITLGDEVVINRGTTIQSKMGGISIGANSDVGASTIIVAQGGIRIGAMVTIAAGCKIGGGRIRTSSSPLEADAENLGNDFAARGQERLTKGPIRIDDRSVLLSRAMVLDGVRVGKNCLVGPGAIVLEDIPQDYVATPHQRLVAIPRTVTAGTQTSTVNEMQAVKDDVGPTDSETGDAEPHDESAEITELVFAAIDALNEMRPEDRVVSKALETSLVGASGELDSMELVNLVVDLEQRVEHALGISIILSSPDDMAGDASPFATVQSLITHIDSLTHRGHAG